MKGEAMQNPQDMQAEMDDVVKKIDSIRTQIEYAKLYGCNPEWRIRAKHCLGKLLQRRQQLQQAIGAARKQERVLRNNTFERKFMDIAKERLDASVFSEIATLALQQTLWVPPGPCLMAEEMTRQLQ